jgi:hypothetical protein
MILLFLVSVVAAQENEENQPAAFIKELSHDMGTIYERDSYVHKYIVQNTGKADLIIESVKPG